MEASWNGGHNITDLSGNRLDDLGAGTVWEYTLIDTVAPTVSAINPVSGATLSHLTQIAVSFSEAVAGVDAADLLVNGQPASQVTGSGAGPYTFVFGAPGPGTVAVSWAVNHGIHDLGVSPNELGGGSWSYTLHPGEFSGNVVINEFLASNVSTNGLRDEDGDLEDWVELYNRGGTAVNLGGWSLTDDPEVADLWVLPAVTLGPGQYLLVFASGKDRSPTNGGNLHANFKLSTAGQYLGLFNANFPREVATQFLPGYPEQRPDIAYGLYNDTFGYLTNPTPRSANSGPASFSGLAADPQASVSSGLFKHPFSLTLSTATAGASIRYTLDGSEPTATGGMLYTGPISVSGSASQAVVNVRAVALRGDLLGSHVITHSYIFPDYVLVQPANPAGFPVSWVTQTIGWDGGAGGLSDGSADHHQRGLRGAGGAGADESADAIAGGASGRFVRHEPGDLRQSESGAGGTFILGAGGFGGVDSAGREPGFSSERGVADTRRHQPGSQLDSQTLVPPVFQEHLWRRPELRAVCGFGGAGV